VIVLGFDGGLANLGIACVSILRGTRPSIDSLDVMRTEPEPHLAKSEDATRRVRAIAWRIFDGARRGRRPVALVAESFSPPRSSTAAAKVAMVWGAIVTFAEVEAVPLFTYPPKHIKGASGAIDASKPAMRRAMAARWGEAALRAHLEHITPRSAHEHPIDALAAITAWLDDEPASRSVINRNS
jgi:Holliday junction resolvasome RuvABC endonuclease subunit